MRLQAWYFLSIMASYLSLFFSTALILDLYFLLKNPFSSTEARLKKMTTLTVFFSLLFSALGLWLTISEFRMVSSLNLYLFLLISVANILLAATAMGFVIYRFRTKGMSRNIKKQI